MSKTNEVDELMAALDHPLKPEIEALRKIILSADARINESVKWNAPSFFVKEHFATFKLYPPKTLQVVFHTDAKAKDNVIQGKIDDLSGLLKWVAKDRAVASFSDMEDVKNKEAALTSIVKQWLEQV